MHVDKRYMQAFSLSKVKKLKYRFMAMSMTIAFKVIVQLCDCDVTLAMRNEFT